MNPDEKPRLRAIDVRRTTHDEIAYFILGDPLQISENKLHIPAQLGPVLALLDGTRRYTSIAGEAFALYGGQIEMSTVEELVEAVVDALDDAYMLDNARFRTRHDQLLADYRSAPNRPPALAQRGYPAERAELWTLLQEYLEDADGIEPATVDWTQGVGILSPHIDYTRGGAIYAQTWKQAAVAVAEADIAILFGTDHYGDDLFTLTRQSYATPYGTLPTDVGVVDALAAALGEEAAYAGELRHRGEHSLELVAVWLHHIRGGTPLPLVPILVGSLHRHMQNGSTPQDDPAVQAVLATLRTATAGKRVLYVASGDLAHVGPAFGGKPLGEAERALLRRADRALLRPLEAGDGDAFFAAIKRVNNANNVCGVTPFYLALRSLGTVKGKSAGYALCPADDDGTSVVSVAGMLLQGE